MKKGDQKPFLYDDILARSSDIVQLFDTEQVIDTNERISPSLECGAFRHFTLYLDIDSTGSPTTLQIKAQFLNRTTGKWHTYKQSLFASLFYEDTDVASGVKEMFNGDCAGREFRITLTGVGTTSSAYFTVSASVEFYN